MSAKTFISILLIYFRAFRLCDAIDEKERDLSSTIESKLEIKFQDYVVSAAKWLEGINDRNLANSELGRLIHYNEIKPKLDFSGGQDRSVKKMSMAMMPLVFHVGASSTWMLITSLMAAKSVAIGIALLVFKIAVSSAKVASFFTALKSKHSGHHHHDWSWAPHYEHHEYERSLPANGPPISHSEWSPQPPGWSGEAYKANVAEDFEEALGHDASSAPYKHFT